MKKRILSAFVMLCMMLTLLPGGLPTAQASETADDSENPLTPPTVQRQAVANGGCGTNLTWTLDSDGLLAISGTGAMMDYELIETRTPWEGYNHQIKLVVIADGATSIGQYAFQECSALTCITIPKSVTSIGTDALPSTSLPQINYTGTQAEWAALAASSSLTLASTTTVVCVGDTYHITGVNGGFLQDETDPILNMTYSVMESAQVINLGANPEHTGYTFGGWTSDSSDISIDADSNITLPAFYHEDITLTALWKRDTPQGEKPVPTTYTPTIYAADNIKYGMVNPSVTIKMFEPSAENSDCKFADEAMIRQYFVTNANTASLSLNSITRVDDYTITLNFTGTAQTGRYLFSFLSSAFSSTSNLTDSNMCNLVVDAPAVTTPQLTAALQITANDENPQQIFASTVPFDPTEAAKPENYTVSYRAVTRAAGDLTLVSAAVSGADNKMLTLQFNGTAQEGTLDLEFPTSIFAPEAGYTVQSPVRLSANIAAVPQYTITFNPGDHGTGSMESMTATKGEAFTFPACTFTPQEGYTFRGWHVDGDASAPFSAGSTYTFTADTLLTAIWDEAAPDTPDPEPTPSGGSGGGGTKRRNPTQTEDDQKKDTETSTGTVISVDNILTKDIEENVISGIGESYLQSMVKKENIFVNWIDRIQVPAYANTLYKTMVKGSDTEDLLKCLIDDSYFTIDPNAGKNKPDGMIYDVTSAETVTHTLPDSLAAYGDNPFHTETFTDDSYNVVNVTDGDKSINYAALKEGDAVKTSTFNGIYVTKIRKTGNTNYESARKDACTYAASVYQAFDRDHPEVFWLSGTSKLRILTAKVKYGTQTVEEAYMFFTLADNSGFSLRTPDYQTAGTVAAGIQKRDQLRDTILASVTGTNSYEKVRQLNRWLTEHNEYNTTPDLTTIGNAPHECLSALAGSVGVNGPVCDGYSKAFKVLCDKLGIPCVLADGYAKPRAQDAGEAHMWNYVQMDDQNWYGVDVTWNDPMVKGVSGAKSGYENEKFLLVGTNTVIEGVAFGVSHPETNRAANGGVSFINGPRLNGVSFDPSMVKVMANPLLHFTDASADEWYAESVKYVYEKSMMSGTSNTTFSPNETTTRGMLISILHRLDGEKSAPSTAFTDVPAGQWYANAVNWAVANNIAGGYGNGRFGAENVITREQMAVILYNFAKYKGYDLSAKGNLSAFTDGAQLGSYAKDAMQWANGAGLITGTSATTLAPTGSATRAQAASILMRFCENIVK